MDKKELKDKKQVEIEAPKKIKYQCLHTEEARECTCIRSKGLVLKKQYLYNLYNLSINGYGKCKLYVYFENQNCISIKLKDNSYIFFNDKSNDETLKYYSELEKALEKS